LRGAVVEGLLKLKKSYQLYPSGKCAEKILDGKGLRDR